jgi:hypothetical protein
MLEEPRTMREARVSYLRGTACFLGVRSGASHSAGHMSNSQGMSAAWLLWSQAHGDERAVLWATLMLLFLSDFQMEVCALA